MVSPLEVVGGPPRAAPSLREVVRQVITSLRADEDDVTLLSREKCHINQNKLLAVFLKRISVRASAEGQDFLAGNVNKALQDCRNTDIRITNAQELRLLKGLGPALQGPLGGFFDAFPQEARKPTEKGFTEAAAPGRGRNLSQLPSLAATAPKAHEFCARCKFRIKSCQCHAAPQPKSKKAPHRGKQRRPSDEPDLEVLDELLVDGYVPSGGSHFDATSEIGEYLGLTSNPRTGPKRARAAQANARADQPNKRCKPAGKRYVPSFGSAPYALLLTLREVHREGLPWISKADLMDRAEASGLSTKGIRPVNDTRQVRNYNGVAFQYCGWNCMKTLEKKDLVKRESNPAKFSLTPQGAVLAEELHRLKETMSSQRFPQAQSPTQVAPCSSPAVGTQFTQGLGATTSNAAGRRNSVPLPDGPSLPSVPTAPAAAANGTEAVIVLSDDEGEAEATEHGNKASCLPTLSDVCTGTQGAPQRTRDGPTGPHICEAETPVGVRGFPSASMRAEDKSFEPGFQPSARGSHSRGPVRLPPIQPGSSFAQEYTVVVLMDHREHVQGSREQGRMEALSAKAAELRLRLSKQAPLPDTFEVEVRELLVGDVMWIARHKVSRKEYILDVIVERKRVDDLASSIVNKHLGQNRYQCQKHVMKELGLRYNIYLVEGDPDAMDRGKMVKTAATRTEVFDGFHVCRTADLCQTHELLVCITVSAQRVHETLSRQQPAARTGVAPALEFGSLQSRLRSITSVNVRSMFGMMLAQVHGLGACNVANILHKYPTPMDLHRALAGKTKEESLAELQRLPGVGPQSSQSLLALLRTA